MKGLLFDIQRGAMQDGPGIRTTLFLKGCPLRCPWCHNPESRSPFIQVRLSGTERRNSLERIERDLGYRINEQHELYSLDHNPGKDLLCDHEVFGRYYTVNEIMEIVKKDRVYYQESEGGVTISGGEPLFQPGFTTALLKALRAEGYHVVLDTSGWGNTEVYETITPLVDLFLFDIKFTNDALYQRFIGYPLKAVLSRLTWLNTQQARIILRSPVIPGWNDNRDHIDFLKRLRDGHRHIMRVELLEYHDYYKHKLDYLPVMSDFLIHQPPGFRKDINQWQAYLDGG